MLNSIFWQPALMLSTLTACVSCGIIAAPSREVSAAEPGADQQQQVEATGDLSWCNSLDSNKLDLVVTRQGQRYFMTNAAKYQPADKNCYYYVNWDLQGTHLDGKPIENLEVEPNSLYLVHLYELSRPKTLGDFWSEDPGKQATTAFVWVGGLPTVPRPSIAGVTGVLTEIKESPHWFYYRKDDRLPFYSQRFQIGRAHV